MLLTILSYALTILPAHCFEKRNNIRIMLFIVYSGMDEKGRLRKSKQIVIGFSYVHVKKLLISKGFRFLK